MKRFATPLVEQVLQHLLGEHVVAVIFQLTLLN
jgi:hypothetical protein